MQHLIDKARVLIEALPYISAFRGRTVVVKCGGRALEDLELRRRFAEDIVLLGWVGINVVVVHGGGKQISRMLDRLGIESTFHEGLRVTDDAVLEAVEMVLGGTMNKELVRLVNNLGGRAVGITGKDGGMVRARRISDELGHVGQVVAVDRSVIDHIITDFTPIIAPLATGEEGETLNINADPFAAHLAVALGAEKLVLLTDVPGVKDGDGELITTLHAREVEPLIESGVISGGMIPKVRNALEAVSAGVRKVHIIDGRLEHALLLEVFTEQGVGTQVLRQDVEEPKPRK